VKDEADNQNPVDPSTSVPLFITANPAVFTPAPPRFEGTMVSRIAVVVGGAVGPWSAPSVRVLVDRQAPPIPPNLTAPLAMRTGPHTIDWGLVVDGFTGTSSTEIEQLELSTGARQALRAPSPETSLVVTPNPRRPVPVPRGVPRS
jgi:hypothetical protein